jgi:hypothetical protein
MRRAWIALALLLVCSGARAEDYHAVGSICTPTTKPAREPVCALWYAPAGYRPVRSFHEELPWENRLKADRLVPARPVTAEAAPK